MNARLSVKQAETLRDVKRGIVTYGDPYPNLTERLRRRFGASKFVPEFMRDGAMIYFGEHGTLSSLAKRDLIVAECDADGTPRVVILTDAGRAALAKSMDRT